MKTNLRAMRKERGMTQQDLASLIGVTKGIVGSWEREETALSLEDACNIADVFDCTLDELAGRKWSPDNYTDAHQAALNGYYESMNEKGRSLLVESAKHMSSSTELRIEKERQYPHNQVAMGA